MNPYCDECGAPDGCYVVRDDAGNWLKLRSDRHYETPKGIRLRMVDLPEAFEASPLVKVRLEIVADVGTPRCLCQHCAAAAARRKHPRVTAQQLSFADLFEGFNDGH